MTTPVNQPNAEALQGFRVVEISTQPIELYKILKFQGMATSGGHAKAGIAAGEVRVNGQFETQKRKKMVSGDTIEFNGEKIFIKFPPPMSERTTPCEHDVNTEVAAQGSGER